MHSSLLEKLVTDHDTVTIGGSRVVMPDGEMQLFLIRSGRADISVVPLLHGQPNGPRRFLCSFEEGELLLVNRSEDGAASTSSFLLSAVSEATVTRCPLDTFLSRIVTKAEQELSAAALDRFFLKLTASLSRGNQPKIVQHFLDEHSDPLPVSTGQICSTHSTVTWFRVASGSCSYHGDRLKISQASGLTAMTPATWATASEDSLLETFTTHTLLADHALLLPISTFLLTARAISEADDADSRAHDLDLLQARRTQDAALMNRALTRFTQLFVPGRAKQALTTSDPLLSAVTRVAEELDIPLASALLDYAPDVSPEDQLQDLVRNLGVRTRKVALTEGWWRKDCGPLIGFTSEGQPVALIGTPHGEYQAYSADGEAVKVLAATAEQLRYFAFMLYRPFPDRPLSGLSLFKFGILGIEKDLYLLVLMGVVGSLLSLAVPIVTGLIFDSVIPQAQRNQLWLLCLALSLCAIAAAVFDLTKRMALFRIESRMDQHIQGAVWDRLIKLPVSFFRQFSSGDLADRSLGISSIRQTLSDTVTESLLSAVFSLTSLALLFYYSFQLALVAIALAAFAVIGTTILGTIQTRYQKNFAAQRGELSGKVLDLVNCIAKFKIAGAEDRAFSRWAEAFFNQKKTILKVRTTGNLVRVFSEVFPLVASIVIFSMIMHSKTLTLSVGGFLAFNAAFTQFVSTLMSMSLSLMAISSTVPSYNRCRPIMDALPERDGAKEHPGILKGDIEVSGVSFRYAESTPDVLSDISFRILPGEFVAVVGTSGGGKSTLTRMLLGFEKPSSGCVFYDGKDLEQLDVHQVRRQIGVVLQNGRLIAGDILSNIVGSRNLTIEHAWEAARLAGLEEDIAAMPMGMHTFISEGGGNLSGGQRQRMLIARALVNKPSMLIFDEATSALDNRTQAIINESLESLRVTRIVIAHRLSTIHRADKIMVLDKGKIVECGNYAELMQLGGIFADLAHRQVA
ncbi:MAG TPA: NHLP bacteriocin export ABC transporter permease/ATPase subunit [Desulfuromonadales bacterium]|nr:NHLP bacteriocin export ABC transporter permease/ATPase subunit [Desulfuromonadales bacterium]